MAGGANLEKLAKNFGQLYMEQIKAKSARDMADAQAVAATIGFQGRQRQFQVDLAQAKREAEAEVAANQADPAAEPPEIPQNALPDPRNPLNGLPTALTVPEAVVAGGPQGIIGGGAVQAGMGAQGAQGGGQPGQSVEGFAVPPMLQSMQQSAETQYAQHEVSPFMTEFVPLTGTKTSVTTTPNVLSAQEAAQLKIQRARMITEERQVNAQVFLDTARTYGAASGKIADALYRGDYGLVSKLAQGTKTISEKIADASINSDNAHAEYYRGKLAGLVGEVPFSVRNGLISPFGAKTSFSAMTANHLTENWRTLYDKDGKLRAGAGDTYPALQLEFANRGWLITTPRIVALGKDTPGTMIPMNEITSAAVGVSLGDAKAIKTFRGMKIGDVPMYVVRTDPKTKKQEFVPNPNLGDINTIRILNGILNEAEVLAKVAKK